MRQEIVVKGKGLAGSSDLTLLAPIKPGFVPALDSVTYKSRVKRLLKTLHLGRSSAHEYALARPLSDAVERIARIHSVRVVVVEPDNMVLLTASFDGSWESYFRVLWQKTGRLLDAIYCNTVGYTTAWDHSYEEWRAWARSVQLETDFYYGLPGMTVDDQRYLRDTERHARRHPAGPADPVDAGMDNLRYVLRSVEDVAQSVIVNGTEDQAGDGVPAATGLSQREQVKQGLQSLSGLYALTDLYLPGTADGAYLQRAAVEFLSELGPDVNGELNDELVLRRFERQVRWLEAARREPLPASRVPPLLPTVKPAFDAAAVQGGIVQAYDAMTHGCLLLLAFESTAAAAQWLARLLDPARGWLTTAAPSADPVKRNLAFTFEGLRQCGLDEAQLALFPDEFRHGMAARAGPIGDLRTNHPRRWARPRRLGAAPGNDDDRIDLAAVHAVLQLRTQAALGNGDSDYDASLPGHPLHGQLALLVPAGCGTRILAVESTRRQFHPATGQVVEHFGFVDSNSGPTIDPNAPDKRISQVQLGELLIGYDNESDSPPDPAADPERAAWLHNGSFLVVRKLRQFVDRLGGAVEQGSGGCSPAIDAETLYGKLVGRRRDGSAMVSDPGGNNNFTYAGDPQGRQCPLQAHIRRANPRTPRVRDGRRPPRLARRGMSYGRPYDPALGADAAPNDGDRGLLFMAYNTSLGEQFEVIQRWLNGGNSTGSTSGQSDPLLGVPENGRQRWFQFEHNGAALRVALDGSDQLFDDARPFVRLEWGAYFFAPSMSALGRLRDAAAARTQPALAWDEDEGERTLQTLLPLGNCPHAALEWKRVLEDIESVRTFAAASVWAAIRNRHGGLLRTPYGVLVADAALVRQVLADTRGHSVSGYLNRMRQSIGADHLGLDDSGPGCPYRAESKPVNDAILALDPDAAFSTARAASHAKLDQMIADARTKAADFADPRFELAFDPRELIDEMLAELCETWFGIEEKETGHFKRGGLRWDWQSDQPPLYPGHFGTASRYIFQPQPGPEVVHHAIAHGMAVRTAARRFIDDYRARGWRPTGPDLVTPAPVGEAVFGMADAGADTDLAARALAGAIMGFVPTVDGALRRVLSEWLGDGTFWQQRALRGGQPYAGLAAASTALFGPMVGALQLRPMPELIWRTAAAAHTLTGSNGQPLQLQAGDTVVLAQVSALQQDLATGGSDIHLMFGGDRRLVPHPTHACPGFQAGIAAMLGTLAAVLERPDSMRPGAAPPSLVIEGDTLAPAASNPQLPAQRQQAAPSPPATAAAAAPNTMNKSVKPGAHSPSPTAAGAATTAAATPAATRGVLLAWGDSWLCYRSPRLLGQQSNLMKHLLADGFKSAPQSPYAQAGAFLSTLAGQPLDDQVYAVLDELLATGQQPQALLLSAGGNDCVKKALLQFVRDSSSGTRIDAVAWKRHLDTLTGYFNGILDKISTLARNNHVNTPIAVVTQGYDHPVADGHYLFGGGGGSTAWLYGWLVTQLHYSVPEATAIMKDLINGLNGIMASLPANGLVRPVHVDLTGTLRAQFGAALSDDEWAADGHKLAWENELHPTPAGFRALATRLTAALDAL